MKTIYLFVLATFILITSCNNNSNKQDETPNRTSFFDKAGMDTTTKPFNDFFTYANGSWMKNTAIPEDQTGWGSFYNLYQDNQKHLRTIIEEAAKSNAAVGSIEQKVGDYYTSGMDTLAIEKIGIAPILPIFKRIDSVKDYKQLLQLLQQLNKEGQGDFLYGFGVGADEKNSKKNIPLFSQAGLTMPAKDYYTKQDSASKAARDGMIIYATKLFQFIGTDAATASKNASAILALETEISASHLTPEEKRDPQKNYNKMLLTAMEKSQPNLQWKAFFETIGASTDSINVRQPLYFAALNSLIASKPIEVWKAKIKFNYMANNANLLNKNCRDAAFEYNKIFGGQKVDQPRWKIMVNRIDKGLADLAGQLYVKKYFTDAAKKRMDELINNLQAAFELRIQKNDWMTEVTKKRAVDKLHSFFKKIGYPTKWKSFDDVTISKNDFFANTQSIRRHAINETIAKIGKDVDKTEWGMTAPTVNAYYNPTNNEIVFPAGILQFPFFDANADDAINYGGIGMVIGHEMTHGFDDKGAQYDDQGNLKDWWTAEDKAKFKIKTDAVVKQYDAYTMFGNVHVKGELTQGENIADMGGLAIAYDAFKMTKQGKDTIKIDGFTPDQRFFLGMAQIWRSKSRDENMRTRLNTDPHSPEIFRINGPLVNFEPFYKAFNVKEGDGMYLSADKRSKIW